VASARHAMKISTKKNVITFEGPVFYCREDEDRFFAWLYSIRAYKDVKGAGFELRVTFRTSRLSRRDASELVSLFSRYDIDLRHLRPVFGAVRDWLPETWRTAVFGRSGTIKPGARRAAERFRARVTAAMRRHAATAS
jgi:hypothetical protein